MNVTMGAWLKNASMIKVTAMMSINISVQQDVHGKM
jgi:hypothetical protein